MEHPVLAVEEVSFRYDQSVNENILEEVSFDVRKGEWLAIVGHNGCGKSTLSRLLVGLLVPNAGCILLDGHVLTEDKKWELRKKMGIVFQNPENQFLGTTVQDDVAFSLENLNMSYEEMRKRVDHALQLVEMQDYASSDPASLSGGQKQRVAIAGVLALTPSLLILDEALVMLDPRSRRQLISVLQQLKVKENISIVSITHDMEEASKADRILVMKKGRIVANESPRNVFQKELLVEKPFAESLRRELEKRNRSVPGHYMTEEELVHWLCR